MMPSLRRTLINGLLGLGVLVPDLALAAPQVAPVARESLVIETGGVVCDFNGCRPYDPRPRTRIYIDPPVYDDPYYEPVPVYPRPHRRVYIDPPVYQPSPVVSRRHIAWCLDRYRSYNPRTDLYLAKRGVYRRCISPYL